MDSNALAKSKRKQLMAPSNLPKRVIRVEGPIDTLATLLTNQ
jgi:hypothetical protein